MEDLLNKLLESSIHDYSNTQILLPTNISSKIIEFGKSIPDNELYIDPNDPSYGREEESHITVRYGLNTNDDTNLKKAFKGFGAVDGVLGKISLFNADDYDVVKVEVDSPDLEKANKLVGEIEAVPGEMHKDYKPHATIAYVKSGEGDKYDGNDSLQGLKFSVDSIELRDKDDKLHTINLI